MGVQSPGASLRGRVPKGHPCRARVSLWGLVPGGTLVVLGGGAEGPLCPSHLGVTLWGSHQLGQWGRAPCKGCSTACGRSPPPSPSQPGRWLLAEDGGLRCQALGAAVSLQQVGGTKGGVGGLGGACSPCPARGLVWGARAPGVGEGAETLGWRERLCPGARCRAERWLGLGITLTRWARQPLVSQG